ncbi:tRNA (guanosine(18)-2'-O)-methyltransferase TrmH [Oceanobacter mangrovi]|uniref:tRNA (guanosine(18)-2'-O)-methyltransferase TrmH n=1 Tax=Oceanobacter mangrovi TaxID=2862510 RepID=UPI001C8D1013|nr:tRNA (guanosine(18)-2'-O)-methyltransferase TrmH [Oceanobacter mangrovi]
MTPDRLERVLTTLNRRQPDLTVITDEVYKSHNLAAIARSCDAFAIQDIQVVWPGSSYRLSNATSAGSESWIDVNTHADIQTAIGDLKQRGFKVVAAHLTDRAIDFRQYDFTQPTAVLMGAEKEGVSDTAAELADEHLIIPMFGMVQSLNVSVAASIILNEAARQREAAGMFDQRRLSDERFEQLLFEWCQPSAAKLCQKYQLPYPALREDGEIADPQAFSQLINNAD